MPKDKTKARAYSASEEKLKKNNDLISEIQQCDFLIEISTSTQLPAFFWQTNSDEVVNKHLKVLL